MINKLLLFIFSLTLLYLMDDSSPQFISNARDDKPSLAPAQTIYYDGSIKQIARLWIINVLLFVVTLSLYRFWGRTRIRQYVWSHISMLGDRLEYTGTGKELFLGFLCVLPILGILLWLDSMTRNGGFSLAFFIIGYYAIYSGMRYRVNRTRWRGVLTYMDAKGYGTYQQVVFKRMLVNLITLGISVPYSQLLQWKALVENMYVGNIPVRFHVEIKGIYGVHIITALIGGIGFGFFSRMALAKVNMGNIEHDANSIILAMLMGYTLFYLIRQAYVAILVRHKFNGLSIGNVRFIATFTIWDFVSMKLINVAILLVTLGTGAAFILHVKALFFSRYIHIEGTLDDATSAGLQQKGNIISEGFLDAVGIDVGVFS